MRALGVNPILNVTSLPESFAWFEQLGWRKGWDWNAEGHPAAEATFGAVASGEVQIFLCKDGQGGRGQGRGVWMSVWVEDVDAVHARCVNTGLAVTQPPQDEPWGVREMHVRHPDGHVLRISTSLRGRAPA